VVTCAEAKERAEQHQLALAFIGDLGSRDFTVFMSVAENPNFDDKYRFFHTADLQGCDGQFDDYSPALVLFRKFDESPLVYGGAISDIESLLLWLQGQSVPTLIEFSEEFIEPIFGQRKLTIFLFRGSSKIESSFEAAFAEVAQTYRGQLLFVTSGVTEGIQGRLGEFMGLEAHHLPHLVILDSQDDMKKYAYPEPLHQLTADSLIAFIEQFKQGKLSPTFKSQEIPEDDGRALKTIVGKNFR
jgi:protein disulfide-isomerase A1